jgi:hypothetical protein
MQFDALCHNFGTIDRDIGGGINDTVSPSRLNLICVSRTFTRRHMLCLCHIPAFLRACKTHFGALLTMLRFVLGTFITTRLTNPFTERAEFRGIR